MVDVAGRREDWGAFAGVAAMGALACAALVLMDLYALSGVASAWTLYWLARRVVGLVPDTVARTRLAPGEWSTYDRRRSGRAPLVQRLATRLRRRRQRDLPPRLGPQADWPVGPPRRARDVQRRPAPGWRPERDLD
jgi:hypothetical protein